MHTFKSLRLIKFCCSHATEFLFLQEICREENVILPAQIEKKTITILVKFYRLFVMSTYLVMARTMQPEEMIFQVKVIFLLVVEVFSSSALAVAMKNGTTTAMRRPPTRTTPKVPINIFPAIVFCIHGNQPGRLQKCQRSHQHRID